MMPRVPVNLIPSVLEANRATTLDLPPGTIRSAWLELPPMYRHEGTIEAYLNGTPVPIGMWGSTEFLVGDDLTFVNVPRLPAAAAGFIQSLLLSAAISYIAQRAFAQPLPKLARDDESSPVYGFRGQTNNRSQGEPIEVGYGRCKVGGTVVSEYVETINGAQPRSIFRQLLCLGWGPFKSIAGLTQDTPAGTWITGAHTAALGSLLEIEGSPASAYRDVRIQVRLGNNTQDPILGFERVRSVEAVGPFELTSPEITSGSTAAFATGFNGGTGALFDGTNATYFATWGRVYDVTTLSDEVILRLRAPQGYYRIDTNGAVSGTAFWYQVRLRELDGGGSPIGSYIYLPPTFVGFGIRESFDHQVSIVLVDPSSYDAGTVGKALDTTGGVPAGGLHADIDVPPHAQGSEVPEFSAATWIKPDANPSSSAGDVVWLFGDYDSTGGRGWGVYFERVAYPFFSGIQRWVLRAIYGGEGTDVIAAPLGGLNNQVPPALGAFSSLLDLEEWTHIAVSYKRGSHFKLYINGVQIASAAQSAVSAAPMTFSVEGLYVADSSVGLGDIPFDGYMDSIAVFDVALLPGAVSALYANGFGSQPETAGLVAHYKFESTLAIASSVAGGWYGAFDTPISPATSGTAIGVIREGAFSAPRRMRARVEIARINPDADMDSVFDTIEWLETQVLIDAALVYPNKALLAIEIEANDQLNNSTPRILPTCEMRLVPVWDGISPPSAPTIVKKWSDNPAWCALDILIDPVIGFSRAYGIASSGVDLASFGELAAICDEIVYSGRLPIIEVQTSGFDDVVFDNSTADEDGTVRGSISFYCTFGAPTPADMILPPWAVIGTFVRPIGYPTADGETTNISIDPDEPGGYELYALERLSSGSQAWILRCYWDRLAEPDPWTTGGALVLDSHLAGQGGASALADATIEHGERRHRVNGVFDTVGDAWEALLRVLGVGRALPIREGKTIRVRADAPRGVVRLVTSASIEPGSFEVTYGDPREAKNGFDYEILDEEEGFERLPVSYVDPEVANEFSLSELNKGDGFLWGVTSRGQALRQARFDVAIGKLRVVGAKFTLGRNALGLEFGDVVRLAHDILPRGVGGRALGPSDSDSEEALRAPDDLTAVNWTASSVSTSAGATDPWGDATTLLNDASAVALGVLFQASPLSVALGLSPGPWSASAITKAGTSTAGRIEIVGTANGRRWAAFSLAGAGSISAEGGDAEGGASISAIGATGWYVVSVWIAFDPIAPSDTLTWGIRPATSTDGTAVATTGTMSVGRPTLCAGKSPALFGLGSRMLVPSTDLEIDESETVYVTTARKRLGSAPIDATLTPAGSYPAGVPIYFDGPLLDAAGGEVSVERDAEYIVVPAGAEMLLSVASTRLTNDLKREVTCVLYDAAVYSDRPDGGEGEEEAFARISSEGRGGTRAVVDRVPGTVTGLAVSDFVHRVSEGRYETRLTASWDFEDEDLARVARVRVWAREAPLREGAGSAPWQLIYEAEGTARSCSAGLGFGGVGQTIEVAVQPVSHRGKASRPEACARQATLVLGIPLSLPPALTRFDAHLSGDQAVYSWGALEDKTLIVEARSGGWVLGQRLFASTPGSELVGPTRNWLGSDYTTPKVYVRTRNAAGVYSIVYLLNWQPVPVTDDADPAVEYPSERWEHFGGGAGDWVNAVPVAGDPTIGAEFEVNGTNGLSYTGASTSTAIETVYTTSENPAVVKATTPLYRETRAAFIEAYLEAVQIHPYIAGGGTVPDDDPAWVRWSDEGPVSLVHGESEAAVWVEMRLNESGVSAGWSEWKRYRPGVYEIVDVQFRIRAQRPSADFNIDITAFHTRITSPRQSLEKATPQRRILDSDFF